MPYVIRPPVRKMALAGAFALAALCALLAPAASQAAETQEGCGPVPVSNPFAIFGDLSDYTPVADGHFESGTGAWSLYGASVVAGNESYLVRDPADSNSLSINQWGKAVSGNFCVDTSYPHFRFFARQSDGPAGLGLLLVRARWTAGDAVYEETLGLLRGSAHRSWQPSEMLPLVERIALTQPGGTQSVRLVFVPLIGTWQIDDVYVDPYRR